jgi:hypothetical protein
MAKSFKTIYFESELMLEAERQKVDLNLLCNEALRAVLNKDVNSGSVAGAVGNFLDTEAEKTKDLQVLKRLSRVRDERFNQGLRIYCSKYGLELHEALKLVGL